MHPFLRDLQPTLHIAHRGGAAIAPENTLFAFHRALSLYRTDMFELDVQGTRDGRLVVFHDATLDRCTEGTGLVSERTLAEIRALDAGYRFTTDGGGTFPFRGQGIRVPTLEELLEAFPSLRLHIELKPESAGFEKTFASILRSHSHRICVGSEDDEVAGRIVEELPDACHFYPGGALVELVLALRAGTSPRRDTRFDVLDVPLFFGGERIVDAALCDAARHLGKWLNVWTVDDPDEMRSLVAQGVGGIMTDRPDLLRAILDRRQG